MNNNGIYSGLDPETWDVVRDGQDPTIAYYFITILRTRWLLTTTLLLFRTPPLSLLPECHYEMLPKLGRSGKGFLCRTIDELDIAMKEAIEHKSGPSLINVLISPVAQRKPQEHDWLTRSKL